MLRGVSARFGVVVIAFGLMVSCFSTAKYDEAHAARVRAIDLEYGGMEADARRSASQLRKGIEELRQFLVPVVPGSAYAPAERIDAGESYVQLRGICAQADRDADAQPDAGLAARFHQIADECRLDLFKKWYLPALRAKYYSADVTWVSQQWTKGTDLESLFAYSHNTETLRGIREQEQIVEDMLERHVTSIRNMRASAVNASAQQRDGEVVAARAEHRAAMMAIANALQSSSQQSRRDESQNAGCSSDFECSMGQRCLKNNYAFAGVCVKSVNAYGNQTFNGPQGSSIGPKLPVSTDCKGFGDCPIGFSCDTPSGACIQ